MSAVIEESVREENPTELTWLKQEKLPEKVKADLSFKDE